MRTYLDANLKAPTPCKQAKRHNAKNHEDLSPLMDRAKFIMKE
ncbi:hypothetical protein [Geobacter sp. AOG2]|nr:hypothetical protein [Geobacter sp. AOG2]